MRRGEIIKSLAATMTMKNILNEEIRWDEDNSELGEKLFDFNKLVFLPFHSCLLFISDWVKFIIKSIKFTFILKLIEIILIQKD